MMRAALLGNCGVAPALGTLDRPAPHEGELLVRVTAASITPLDLLCASGTSYFGVPATPYVPGVQGVGERADGTAVWFATSAGMRPGDGSMAEYAVVRSADTVELPDGVDHKLVAALGLSAVAAYMALTWRGGLQAGEQVLVLGGGGVVGQAAIQLALLGGARRVVAACRSEAARQRALRLGATQVIPLAGDTFTSPQSTQSTRGDQQVGVSASRSTDHDQGVVIADVAGRMKAAGDGPFDIVLDPLFGVPAAAALRALRPGGVLVNLGGAAGEVAPFDSATLRSGSLRVLGYTNNELTPEQRADALRIVADHVRAGRLTVDYEEAPLADVADAWSRQAAGLADRRIVLVP